MNAPPTTTPVVSGTSSSGGLEGPAEEALEENQDAYHNQCDVGTAYEPGESHRGVRPSFPAHSKVSLISASYLLTVKNHVLGSLPVVVGA